MSIPAQANLPLPGDNSPAPLWASAYLFYKNRMPNHRGKATILRLLHRIGLRQGRFFLWRMRNGMWMAISPMEGFAPWSVGWTCFEEGAWEPHIQRVLEGLVRPGDTVMDIGANIGYFSAVLSRCAGENGRVWAFEPVPSSFERLSLCKEYNRLANVTALPMALGAEDRQVEICFNPVVMGGASIYQEKSSAEVQSATVPMFRLDALIEQGTVTTPDVIKIDVEGHELDALQGARETIARAKPSIVFEYNSYTADKAGWDLSKIADLLTSVAPYRFYSLEEDSFLKEITPATFVLAPGAYVDILADCGRVNLETLGSRAV